MSQTIPPWLEEKVKAYQKSQINLENVQAQLQQLELDVQTTKNALETLEKTPDDKAIYKEAGSILVESDKATMTEHLKEQQELAKTQIAVLTKHKEKIEKTIREQGASLNQAIHGGAMKPGS